jgi:hypothetical protein
MMPFTREEFFQVFAAYNAGIWPMQLVLAAAALWIVLATMRPGFRTQRAVPIVIASLWAWSAVSYHLLFFRSINPLALPFGLMFLLQAVLFVVAARRKRMELRFRPSLTGWLGVALVSYALVAYPILGASAGHVFPASPTFGAPCPLTIFTLGVLLWNAQPTPWYLWTIPLLWSVVATSAAASLEVREDFGLSAAAVVVVAVLVSRRTRRSGSRELRPSLDRSR